MAATSLEVIREVLGVDLTPETIVIATRDEATLKPRLREAYQSRVRTAPVVAPPKRAAEVRPIVEDIFPVMVSLAESTHVLDSLCFPLLYGHSAAAPDVLAAQLDGTDDFDLASVLHVYAAVAPLLDRDLLILVDPTYRPTGMTGPAIFDLLNQLEPLAADLRAALSSVSPSDRRFSGTISVDRPEVWALRTWMWFLDTAARYAVDPFPRTRADELALRTLIASAADATSSEQDPLLATLFTQTTPNLEALTAADIIAIRQDDAFDGWRAELTSALADLRARVDAGVDDVGRREFSQRFSDRARQIERATGRSKALSAMQRTVRTFALSIVGSEAVTHAVQPGAGHDAIVLSGGAAAVELSLQLRDLIRGWLHRPVSAEAVDKHYAVFASQS